MFSTPKRKPETLTRRAPTCIPFRRPPTEVLCASTTVAWIRIWGPDGQWCEKTHFGWLFSVPSSQLLALAVRIGETGHGWSQAAKPRSRTAHFGCTPATSSPMSCRGRSKMRALWSTMKDMPSQPVLFREPLQMAETGSGERGQRVSQAKGAQRPSKPSWAEAVMTSPSLVSPDALMEKQNAGQPS
jgi:hypothetical protein